jgi:probable O-glycosylation ligase (exosortase A-associated)
MLRGILLYILVVVAVPIAFFRPFYGVLIYLWFSFGRPGDFVWPEYTFDYAIWVAGAALVGYIVFEMPRSPVRMKGMWILVMLWGWLAAASVMAADPSIAYPKLYEYSKVFIMAFLTATIVNTEQRVKYVLYTLAVSLGLLGAKGALDSILSGFSYAMQGPGGMISEQNEYALALNMGIPILYWLAKDEPKRWIRLALYGMAAGSALVVVATRSRSGLLGLIMVGLMILIFSKRKVLLTIGLVAACSVLFLYGPEGALERYRTIPTATEEDASAIGRLEAWSAAIQMTKAHPVFGVGLRNFMEVFPQYSNASPRVTHNAIFEMLSETGIPGCAIWVALIFTAMWRMYSLRRRVIRAPDGSHLGKYCLIIIVVLIVYLVPNMFINRQDFDLMYQLIGLSAGLAGVIERKLAEPVLEATVITSESVVPLWQRARG